MDVRRDDAHHERPLQRGRMLMAPYGLKSQYCRTQSAKATNLLSDGGVAAARVAASHHVLVTAYVKLDREASLSSPHGAINAVLIATSHLIADLKTSPCFCWTHDQSQQVSHNDTPTCDVHSCKSNNARWVKHSTKLHASHFSFLLSGQRDRKGGLITMHHH